MRTSIPALLLVSLLSAFVAGCATGGAAQNQERAGGAALQTLFIVGAMKAIEQSDDPVAKAGRIGDIAEQILTVAQSDSVTGAALELLIQEAVGDRVLMPSDRYLLSQIAPLTAAFMGSNGLIEGAQLERLRAFMTDVIAVTDLYRA